jgi:hypothetical protein
VDAPLAVRAVFHPIALVVAYVLSVWLETGISVFAIGRALLVAPVVALLLILIGSIAFRDIRWGGVFASAGLVLLVFGREIWLIVGSAIILLAPWQTALLVGLVVAALALVTVTARHAGWRLPGADAWTNGLDVLAGALLVAVLATGVAGGAAAETVTDLRQGVDLDAAPPRPPDPARPDIYVIFLDGYPRADVLADQYGFDNSPFLAALAQRGLAVAEASHSNYTLTQFALVSMFNVDLLQDIPELAPVIAGDARAQPVSRRILNDNIVLNEMRELGYLTVGLAGTYEDVALRQADIFLETGHMNEIEWRLIARTFIPDVINAIVPTFFRDQQRSFVNTAFEQAARVARDRHIGPRFMLAHVFAPRSPLVFGAEGEPMDVAELRRTDDTAQAFGLSLEEFGRRLRGQVEYVNGKTLDLIDTIQAEAEQPPVIIVMSDHGSRSRLLDADHPDPELVREQFGTLFAAATPGHSNVFPEDVTPAQVMGRLQEAYFDVRYVPPGNGIYAGDSNHYAFRRLGDAPPTPSP